MDGANDGHSCLALVVLFLSTGNLGTVAVSSFTPFSSPPVRVLSPHSASCHYFDPPPPIYVHLPLSLVSSSPKLPSLPLLYLLLPLFCLFLSFKLFSSDIFAAPPYFQTAKQTLVRRTRHKSPDHLRL
ncbi:hypothetical protein ASPVEDRAFT_312600 [Aspergillus versicolor CBS 583.65]|uniref:Uncharacterized protein n=1 Tax=Aspergillus versicolor CBS 583.65 TaxID=1036611 RepID=A0A1L9PX48_ASPVE|nr:uncharacterized protein ASPVEDRAFT_312600 [Aspergillus versicolor CBS 583.65]OJJ06121.1 hypothetical protein ASPVEDRAFT_312600 [Aspergillus versicolor CBS 583.65]